jgi:AAA family ATP:ADP antiporter
MWSRYLPLINDFLDRKVNLRRGERKKVFLLQANIFIIISVLLVLKPVFTSMMLSFHGVDIMPSAYIGIAISAIIVQSVTTSFIHKKRLIHLIFVNHGIQIGALFLIALAIYFGFLNKWLSLVLYIYISIFALVTVTYFYQYCQSLLTIRDAKRIYAFIGSGAIAGGVFGGYFTSIFVPYIGNAGLVLSCVVLMCISAFILHTLNDNYQQDEENTLFIPETPVKTKQQFSIFNNPHVRNIALIIGFGVLVSKLVDYQFNFIAYKSIEGEDALTSFFGFWFSTINVLGLILQMFVVSKVIDRFGVSKSIAIMPIFLLLGGLLILFFPILVFGVLVKLFEGSLKQSIYKTATEINIMPLANSLRNRAKTFVDVVVDSIATGLAGVIIFFLINKANLPFYFVGLMSIMSLSMWIFFIYKSTRTYKTELAKMVRGDHLSLMERERVGSVVKKIAIEEYLIKHRDQNHSTKSILLDLTRHENLNMRRAAILKYVNNYGSSALVDLNHVTTDPSILVRKALYFGLLMNAKTEDQVDELFRDLKTENFIVATAALAEAIGNNTIQKEMYHLYQRIDDAYNKLTFETPNEQVDKYFGQIYKAIAISKYIDRYGIIIGAIKNNADDDLQREALKAIGYGKAQRFLKRLDISDIAEVNLRVYFKTLAVFPYKLLDRLRVYNLNNSRKLFLDLPALEYVGRQKHVDFLFELLDHQSLKVRGRALKIINICRKKYPHLFFAKKANLRRLNQEILQLRKIAAAITYIKQFENDEMNQIVNETSSLLVSHLQRQANRTMLSIFLYIGLVTDKSEIEMIYQAIKSTRRDAALDLLDGILEYDIRKKLIPILELVVNKRYTQQDLNQINERSMNKEDLFDLMKQLKDDRLLRIFSKLEKLNLFVDRDRK